MMAPPPIPLKEGRLEWGQGWEGADAHPNQAQASWLSSVYLAWDVVVTSKRERARNKDCP